MKKPKLKVGDCILIYWMDAGGSSGWEHLDAIRHDPPAPVDLMQVGFYLGETPEALYFTQALSSDPEQVLGLGWVPWGCVRAIHPISLPRCKCKQRKK